ALTRTRQEFGYTLGEFGCKEGSSAVPAPAGTARLGPARRASPLGPGGADQLRRPGTSLAARPAAGARTEQGRGVSFRMLRQRTVQQYGPEAPTQRASGDPHGTVFPCVRPVSSSGKSLMALGATPSRDGKMTGGC